WAWLLTAELVAFLPANALGLTLQLGVGKLDALLGHVSGCEVASSFGFGALLPRWLARRTGPQLRLRVGVVGVVRSVSVICISTLGGFELRSQSVKLFLCGLELDLELPIVDALGFGHEEAPFEQPQLLQRPLVGAPEVIALALNFAELARHLGQLRRGGRQLCRGGSQLSTSLGNLVLQLFDARLAQHERTDNNAILIRASRIAA